MNDIFGNYAKNYYDQGFSVLPVLPGSKSCILKGWPKTFSFQIPSEKKQDELIMKHHDSYIGLACGTASGIVAVDFDYEGCVGSETIEALVKQVLPLSPVIKKGKKGWTAFYRMEQDIPNRCIKNNGRPMIDILSTRKLTVLPPSPHSDKDYVYNWVTPQTLLDVERDDLPVLTKKHIKQLVDISEVKTTDYDQLGLGKSIGRHDIIFGFILRESDTVNDIEELSNKVMDFDLQNNSTHEKGSYFRDAKYWSGKDPKEACKGLVSRVCEWKKSKKKEAGINWEVGKFSGVRGMNKGKLSTSYDDFESFIDHLYPSLVYDKINRAAFHYSKQIENWAPIENHIPSIESRAAEAGLSPSFVKRHLARYIDQMKPKLLIDIPVWDRQDHIKEMVEKLSITNYEPKTGYAVELIKEWLSNVFKRVDATDNQVQNPVWILKGAQGLGKDAFFNHLFKGFGWYYNEIDISQKKVENYQTVSGLLVGNVPEFDETHKLSLGHFKSLITTEGARFRAPYRPKPEDVRIRCSYVSSCNFQNLFRDSSGNRRFLVFEVDKIDWKYRHIDKNQIVAQAFHLSRNDYKASDAAKVIRDAYVSHHTPVNVDDLLLEDISNMLKQRNAMFHGKIRWHQISDDFISHCRKYNIGVRRAQGLLKSAGFTSRDSKGNFYKIPEVSEK